MPVFDDELKEIYHSSKKSALEEFGRVAVGEVQKQFLVELKDKFKHKFHQIRKENEKISEVSIFRRSDEKLAAFFMNFNDSN